MPRHSVYQKFHAVGHGTFFTGLVNNYRDKTFSWVYDCGSSSSKIIQSAIKDISDNNFWPKEIDIIALSHFDNDHVNGLECLLSHKKAKHLVLPYSNFLQRLQDVAFGRSNSQISASTVILQLDPLRWLQAKKLTNQVEQFLFIKGQSDKLKSDDPRDQPEPKFFPIKSKSDSFKNDWHDAESTLIESSDDSIYLPMEALAHNKTFCAKDFSIEFMFYNTEVCDPNLGIIIDENGEKKSIKSRQPLKDVKHEIDLILQELSSHISNFTLPKNWRTELKNFYQKHFGSSSKANNNISLCMYYRPLDDFLYPRNLFQNKPGFLLTGDLTINKNVIAEIAAHIGQDRREMLGIIQVPHHGSKNSWETGNAKSLNPLAFVHCAPGTKNHPHQEVSNDLNGYPVSIADKKIC